MYYETILRHLN